jgi:hypothetical protein
VEERELSIDVGVFQGRYRKLAAPPYAAPPYGTKCEGFENSRVKNSLRDRKFEDRSSWIDIFFRENTHSEVAHDWQKMQKIQSTDRSRRRRVPQLR